MEGLEKNILKEVKVVDSVFYNYFDIVSRLQTVRFSTNT